MSLLGRWSTSGSEGGNAHFLPLQEYDRGNNRTNRTKRLVLTQEQKGSVQHCISDNIYRLTLAWILVKLPQSNWNADSSWLDLLSLVWTPSPPTGLTASVSGVDCPCPWFHANSCQLLSPTNSLLASCYLFRPRWDFKSKNPLSGFAPKQTKESSAWWATYIVLQETWAPTSSVCLLLWTPGWNIIIQYYQYPKSQIKNKLKAKLELSTWCK